MVARILAIAGSDSGGGAGIQADIKTITMLGGYAMTAVTAITVQNTCGVSAVHAVPPEIVAGQIRACIDDIGVDAIKIGMLGNEATINAVADALEGCRVPIVLDPVMIAKGGASLIEEEAVWALMQRLLPMATVITPNVPELVALTETEVEDAADMLLAAQELLNAGPRAVLAKGGHLEGDQLTDWLVTRQGHLAFTDAKIDTTSSHGTGCTLSSALACGLGQGLSLPEAVKRARIYVRLALRSAPGLGQGHGPMGHGQVINDITAPAPALNQITVPATDYAASIAFYRQLGLRLIVDSPDNFYARFEAGNGVTLSIHVGDGQAGGVTVYLESLRLDAWVAELAAAGLVIDQMPQDEDWLWREARLTDPAGNRICLYAAGEARRFPPWRM
ncbi:bifunctional hydroxymethylpyrimidine kinase/phosphomethylpyrimidine kinase [Sandarakinorhabdus sp.]|jgi:hydroxymethylpyrimidine/phosphomethylpyrimidine kinase|uniref:bifunctional hydroxymethylpyrimidine kinase/phosphomethylpyrimidine kinase n=1 Tax=Sandarakinorhabdus sp. TaxID=1916663 RepID=UPI0028B10179|nr:bifunctional hydroxymethylpyrimidine kinase/phosphomethylpyrimidine kinase [Sandarakinorhabdus sp.]